jgi:hypothetical protein
VTLTVYLGSRKLHIHNCYNPPPKLLTSRNLATLQLLPQALSHSGEHILVGDFDLHHPLWGGTLLPTQHTLADDLIEATAHSKMELILPQGTVCCEYASAVCGGLLDVKQQAASHHTPMALPQGAATGYRSRVATYIQSLPS